MARSHDLDTRSLWLATAEAPRFAPLAADARADVCVVGGGIAGLTVAYTLAGVGHDVLVLDTTAPEAGLAARADGHVRNVPAAGYGRLEALLGDGGARKVAQSHAAAANAIEDLCRNEGIDCGFARATGYRVRGDGDAEDTLDREAAAAVRAGLDVTRVPAPPEALAGFGVALRFGGQARLHPLRYLSGLAAAVQRRGVRIHACAGVAEVAGGPGARVRLQDGRQVHAGRAVVLAEEVPSRASPLAGRLSVRQRHVVAYRIADRAMPDLVLFDGAGHAAHVAPVGGETWLVAGGGDADALAGWVRAGFPVAWEAGIRWSCPLVAAADGLACIGRAPGAWDNVFVATADAGDPLTHGTLAGLVLPELVAGRDSPFAALYAPDRANTDGTPGAAGDRPLTSTPVPLHPRPPATLDRQG